MWEDPALSRFSSAWRRWGGVICFDSEARAFPTRCRWRHPDDRAVDDASRPSSTKWAAKRIVVFGHGDAGPIAMLFARDLS